MSFISHHALLSLYSVPPSANESDCTSCTSIVQCFSQITANHSVKNLMPDASDVSSD